MKTGTSAVSLEMYSVYAPCLCMAYALGVFLYKRDRLLGEIQRLKSRVEKERDAKREAVLDGENNAMRLRQEVSDMRVK